MKRFVSLLVFVGLLTVLELALVSPVQSKTYAKFLKPIYKKTSSDSSKKKKKKSSSSSSSYSGSTSKKRESLKGIEGKYIKKDTVQYKEGELIGFSYEIKSKYYIWNKEETIGPYKFIKGNSIRYDNKGVVYFFMYDFDRSIWNKGETMVGFGKSFFDGVLLDSVNFDESNHIKEFTYKCKGELIIWKNGSISNLYAGSYKGFSKFQATLGFTSWDFNYTDAFKGNNEFTKTLKLDIHLFDNDLLHFQYLTTIPQKEIKNITLDYKTNFFDNSTANSVMNNFQSFLFESSFGYFFKFDYRKTKRVAKVNPVVDIYYVPFERDNSLTVSGSDIGDIYYRKISANTNLLFGIEEEEYNYYIKGDFFHLSLFFLTYSKPYQMNAFMTDENGNDLGEWVFLFDSNITTWGFGFSLKNFYVQKRLTNNVSLLNTGSFWGVKELGVYGGIGTIKLQSGIDLVEKYIEMYESIGVISEDEEAPIVQFYRFNVEIFYGYKFNKYISVYASYLYSYSNLDLENSYDDGSYVNIVEHILNKDIIHSFNFSLRMEY